MLVLSRRLNERIVLPSLDVTLQVVSMKPGVVRLGIEAPADVPVLREEILGREGYDLPSAHSKVSEKELNHLLRNCLNIGSVGLTLLKQQLLKGMSQEAVATLGRMERDFQAQQERLEKMIPSEGVLPLPRKPRKALLVEDDKTQCELLAGLLRLSGMEVATADDGAKALDYLDKQARPDFLLLDMLMPHCDGPTTVERIRQNQSLDDVKIFALSGYAPERFRMDPTRSGINKWFRKPIQPEALLRDINRELDAC